MPFEKDKSFYEQLAQQVVGKQATEIAEIRWAKDKRFVEIAGIKAADVPSPGALLFLEIAKADPRGFLEKFAVKLLPTRAQLDSDETFRDDGREIVATIDHIARVRKQLDYKDEE